LTLKIRIRSEAFPGNNDLKSSAAELHRKIDQISLNGIVNTAWPAATYRFRNSRKIPAPKSLEKIAAALSNRIAHAVTPSSEAIRIAEGSRTNAAPPDKPTAVYRVHLDIQSDNIH
jgi:hypothetical protein